MQATGEDTEKHQSRHQNFLQPLCSMWIPQSLNQLHTFKTVSYTLMALRIHNAHNPNALDREKLARTVLCNLETMVRYKQPHLAIGLFVLYCINKGHSSEKLRERVAMRTEHANCRVAIILPITH